MFGRRIAQKIWLGYAIPLAVLVVAGVLVPAALSAILGQITADYERQSRLAEKIQSLERAALETETHLRGYELTSDNLFRGQFLQSRETYRTIYQEIDSESPAAPRLHDDIQAAHVTYTEWLARYAEPLIMSAPSKSRRARRDREFERVRTAFSTLRREANRIRDEQRDRAESAGRVRRVMTLVGPTAALILALLIGRSISLGVTRPLEALTRATEALERGQPALLLADEQEDQDDEIGDLNRSFRRMARTIGQREAVLRAQNDSLGALNRRVEAVLNATNDGIVMLDRAGGFSVVNQRFADLFGIEAETLLDHAFDRAAPLFLTRFKDPRDVRRRMSELLQATEAIEDDTVEIVRPEHRVLRVYSAPVRGEADEILGRIFVFRDVTRETMVDRMKTEFVSTVSHELRTPLTAIKGYVDVILAGQTGPLNELQTEFLTIVQGSTRRLATLINDMLDISRIESGRSEIRRDRVDYGRIVHETTATLAQEAEARGIALTTDVPDTLPLLTADADRVSQVLMNLISNGIKYTPPGGQVSVTVECDDSIVTTCVADTGIGIGDEDQKRLFQKFFRADNSTTRETNGTGLGLAITKAILERLNGSIWVESEPGKGSKFCFTLPAEDAPSATDDGAGAEEAYDSPAEPLTNLS